MDLDTFKSALREAFDAGCEQGGDEATAFEWGSSPGQSRDQAFNDLLTEWNKPSVVHDVLSKMGKFREPRDG